LSGVFDALMNKNLAVKLKKREAVNRYNVGGNSRLEVLDKDDI